jgi:hypothetical protein
MQKVYDEMERLDEIQADEEDEVCAGNLGRALAFSLTMLSSTHTTHNTHIYIYISI